METKKAELIPLYVAYFSNNCTNRPAAAPDK
jgi:hypothetical protein